MMRGTAILFQKDRSITILENIDRKVFEVIKWQSGEEHCTCVIEHRLVDFGTVSPVLWHEEEIDWDYGY